MAGFRSKAQADRCKKLVAEGKMSQADYDRHLADSGGEEGLARLPKRPHALVLRIGRRDLADVRRMNVNAHARPGCATCQS